MENVTKIKSKENFHETCLEWGSNNQIPMQDETLRNIWLDLQNIFFLGKQQLWGTLTQTGATGTGPSVHPSVPPGTISLASKIFQSCYALPPKGNLSDFPNGKENAMKQGERALLSPHCGHSCYLTNKH